VYSRSKTYEQKKLIYLKKENTVDEKSYGNIYAKEDIAGVIKENIAVRDTIYLDQELEKVLKTRGSIKEDTRIIAKGEEVDLNTFQILKSLQNEFEAKVWSDNNQVWIVFGYSILVAMAILMLFLFVQQYRSEVFDNTKKVFF